MHWFAPSRELGAPMSSSLRANIGTNRCSYLYSFAHASLSSSVWHQRLPGRIAYEPRAIAGLSRAQPSGRPEAAARAPVSPKTPKPRPPCWGPGRFDCLLDGGARGTRTPDLLGAIQALSQLSYSPVRASRWRRERPEKCSRRTRRGGRSMVWRRDGIARRSHTRTLG